VNVIIYTHSMEIGGAQLNAIEIGAAMQQLGHTVLLVAEDGQMASAADALGLERVPVSAQRKRPSPGVMGLLTRLVRERQVDVVHGYEWPPALDAWFGPHLRLGTPVVATVYSAVVAPFLPKSIQLIVGVEQLRQRCIADGFCAVDLIEPPVDTDANSPSFDGNDFRAKLGAGPSTNLVVVVCRLVRELKLEGLLTACRVVGNLAAEGVDIRLAIVGDGPARSIVEEEAVKANAFGNNPPAIHLMGEMVDPRPAYAAADIVLGMGGSALRGMAFGKPLIVQGEAGFWKLCDEESAPSFLAAGWYGLGDGSPGDDQLRTALAPLLSSPAARRKLGDFGRGLVIGRFSLQHAAAVQLNTYQRAIELRKYPGIGEVLATASGTLRHKVRQRLIKIGGNTQTDDFNSMQEQQRSEKRRRG
jgi:glycosyltransferase involved in cell wall biosynthesis